MSNNSNKGKKAATSSGRPKIQTLADLNRRSSDDSDDEAPQEFYTGGEKSGMLVQDPSKRKNDVDSIFEQARQLAAMHGPVEQEVPSSSSRSFTGTGRLLSGETISPAPQQPENVAHNIYFWSDGFSVDDGPLRSFDDPANSQFLESIRKSECPKELYTAGNRSAVHVSLIRRNENYPQPVKQQMAFQGVGRTLGGGSTDENPASVDSSNIINTTNQASSLSPAITVDDALPSTSIQLRLADGSRMVARFNLQHTVSHIRAFIDTSRPGTGTAYRLQTSDFPPKQLNDLTKTIEQAGLANSVIIQKF